MDHETNAKLWDSGSESDNLRNQIIIPIVTALLNSARPTTVLDIGSGTGYLARTIDRQLDIRPDWTMVDIDAARAQFATEHTPSAMNANIHVADFMQLSQPIARFDAILLSFTLLEMGVSDNVVTRVRDHCSENGLVVVVMPDVLSDVLEAEARQPGTAQTFLAGAASLPKVDKFTQSEYPFNAIRSESILHRFMRHRFVLEGFERGETDGKVVFVFAFRRK